MALLRAARSTKAQEDAQSALDEADVELEKCKRAVACPGASILLSGEQAAAVSTQVGRAHTIVQGARQTLAKPAFANLPANELAIFSSLFEVVVGMASALPPECRVLLAGTEPAAAVVEQERPLAEDEEWSVAGADGKRIRQKKQRTS